MLKIPVKLIYICGPLSAPTEEGIDANVKRAHEAGRKVWAVGAMAIIPHLNSPSRIFKDVMTAEMIYIADLELLDRCDYVFRLPGWRDSYGSRLETAWANFRQIPVYESFEELEKKLNGSSAHNEVDVDPKKRTTEEQFIRT